MSVAGQPQPYQFAVVRVVPRVERGESLNVGVIVFSRVLDFLGMRVELDEALLRAMCPDCDLELVRSQLAGLERVAAGDPAAGPIAGLSTSERFHWLVAPASTMVQASAAHGGVSADPSAQLERLFESLVRR